MKYKLRSPELTALLAAGPRLFGVIVDELDLEPKAAKEAIERYAQDGLIRRIEIDGEPYLELSEMSPHFAVTKKPGRKTDHQWRAELVEFLRKNGPMSPGDVHRQIDWATEYAGTHWRIARAAQEGLIEGRGKANRRRLGVPGAFDFPPDGFPYGRRAAASGSVPPAGNNAIAAMRAAEKNLNEQIAQLLSVRDGLHAAIEALS